jgi:phosphoenolpyruvate synthase/pyruvate phosphate dikinase
MRLKPDLIDQLLHPTLDPKAKKNVIAKGLPASPGAAGGKVVFSADEAVTRSQNGEKVILVRIEKPGRHPWFARSRRRAHHKRGHDEPCGRGGPRHGPALRSRRR